MVLPTALSPRRTAAALAAMAAATFIFVTTETQPVALLGPLGAGFHVSPSAVGLLMTAYAIVAGATAIPLTFASAGIRRRPLILVCVGMLTFSQVIAALAPSYGVILAARLLCALAHGVFWSVIAQVAASLVAPERAGRATAAAFAGNSLALVAGTPLVTAGATVLGWRASVAALGVLGGLTLLALYLVLPDAAVPERPSPAHFARAMRSRALLVICAVTTVVVIGHFTAFTYFAPIVRADAGLSGAGLAAVLLVYGAAGVLGVFLAGQLADRSTRAASVAGCALVLTALAALTVLHSLAVTIAAAALWGMALTGLPVAWQTAVLRAVPHQPDGASALYVVCFQIGIGGGALLGAALLAADGVPAVLDAAVGAAAAGTALAVVLGGFTWRSRSPDARWRSRSPRWQTR